jgi:predicted AAA+ superfamily ATPase
MSNEPARVRGSVCHRTQIALCRFSGTQFNPGIQHCQSQTLARDRRPHRDVLEGNFQESEFAADLSEVVAGTAPPEYQDPARFFERTFITEGMALLLDSVLKRLSGRGGDPVVQRTTAFGGGKTHTLMAAYHIAGGEAAARDMAGVPRLLDQAGVGELPRAQMVVLDGNELSPSQPRRHGTGTARTLWGDLACQLGGEEGYALVSGSDQDGTSPGKAALKQLFEAYAPASSSWTRWWPTPASSSRGAPTWAAPLNRCSPSFRP